MTKNNSFSMYLNDVNKSSYIEFGTSDFVAGSSNANIAVVFTVL